MKKLSLVLSLLISSFSISQIDGATVFGTDQVLTIQLTFSQTSFWDSLTTNYETETYMPANVTIIDNQGTKTFNTVGVRLKGNSSYGHPGNKKSFKIDFNEYVSGQNYDGLKKLNFNNCFKDPSFMREKIFFDLAREIGLPAPRVNYANVYMNGTFWGFYNFVEQVDDQFLDWAIEEDSGNLFKAGDNFGGSDAAADLKYYGTNQSLYYDRYELKSNESANDWSDLISLIEFINNSSDWDFLDQLEGKFEKQDLLRSIALDNLFANLDSYLNSARNYYIYHNMLTGKWEWIKWDGNEAFGLYTGGPGAGNLKQLAPNYIAADRPLIQRIFANDDLYRAYQVELCELMENYFNSSVIDPKIDAIKMLITSHVYNDGNKQYSDANFNQNSDNDIIISGGGPGGSQTIYGLKSFVQERYSYLQGVINCSSVGIAERNVQSLRVFPNPFSDKITIVSEKLNASDISIANSIGQKVSFEISEVNDGLEVTINAPKGVYFIQVTANESVEVLKAVKE